MTPNQAKKEVKNFADGNGIKYEKITARTVRFSALLREEVVFVKIHGISPSDGVKISKLPHASYCLEYRYNQAEE